MNRVKLSLPAQFAFSTRIRIRITDLNYGGHVGNDTFLSLMQEARQQYLLSLGYGELRFEGVGLIMADAAIEFKAEMNHGDEVQISIAAKDFTRLGFDFYYLLELVKPDGNQIAGKAKTGMLCYDYAAKKVVSVPEAARKQMEGK